MAVVQTWFRKYSVLLALIGIVVLGALPILLYPMGRDQGMYANIGRTIVNGGTPYSDMWDIKPPPIYYMYALTIRLFGDSTAAIRLMDVIAMPFAMLGLVAIGRKVSRVRVGYWGALIFAVFYLSDQFANLTQNDSLVTVPMIWAVVCALKALEHPRGSRPAMLWSFVTGALCGLILWFKQYQAFFVVALIVNHLWDRLSHPPTEQISSRTAIFGEALSFVGGGLVIGGGLLLYFWSRGIVSEMLIVAQSTAAYNAQYGDWSAFLSQMGNYFRFRWEYWGVAFVLAGLWVPWVVYAREWRTWRVVMLWFLAGLAFMVIQRLGFDTHWIPMLPALALFGGYSVERVLMSVPAWRGQRTQRALRVVAGGALWAILVMNTWVPALPYISGQMSREQYFAHFQANDLKPAQSLAVVNYLQDKLARGDSIYIWGFRPEVAFMGGWRPATRYQAQFPLVASWYPPEWRQQNVDTLWAAMPPFVLVMQDDFMPWTTGINADSHTILQDYTELNNWLIANYDRVETLGDFIIWQRKPTSSSAKPPKTILRHSATLSVSL